ncbi:hypothetical protein WA026_020382 [Henosepilachna vigintioctopunctata]|uniref:Uncharacterized protein n=1 Tax=Henosepilachna vigintioctopunctata TaxID=420089 RepID=A0AAW1UQL2_9CUCU
MHGNPKQLMYEKIGPDFICGYIRPDREIHGAIAKIARIQEPTAWERRRFEFKVTRTGIAAFVVVSPSWLNMAEYYITKIYNAPEVRSCLAIIRTPVSTEKIGVKQVLNNT